MRADFSHAGALVSDSRLKHTMAALTSPAEAKFLTSPYPSSTGSQFFHGMVASCIFTRRFLQVKDMLALTIDNTRRLDLYTEAALDYRTDIFNQSVRIIGLTATQHIYRNALSKANQLTEPTPDFMTPEA